MRFISKFGRHSVVIQRDVQEAYATGMVREVQPLIMAQFEPWGLRPEERELAISRWTFNGTVQMEDEVTTLPPDNRIGVFDSLLDQENKFYSDEVREQIEQVLLEKAAFEEDIIAVPATFFPPPWPRYDEYAGSTSALLRKLVDEGHDLEAVLEYERASQNRDDVVVGLEGLIHSPESEPEAEEVLG